MAHLKRGVKFDHWGFRFAFRWPLRVSSIYRVSKCWICGSVSWSVEYVVWIWMNMYAWSVEYVAACIAHMMCMLRIAVSSRERAVKSFYHSWLFVFQCTVDGQECIQSGVSCKSDVEDCECLWLSWLARHSWLVLQKRCWTLLFVQTYTMHCWWSRVHEFRSVLQKRCWTLTHKTLTHIHEHWHIKHWHIYISVYVSMLNIAFARHWTLTHIHYQPPGAQLQKMDAPRSWRSTSLCYAHGMYMCEWVHVLD